MRGYVLDTQLYVDYLNGRPNAPGMQRFLGAFVSRLQFHAVVGAELLFGARTGAERRRLDQALFARFPPHRLVVPTFAEWRRAGSIIQAMASAGEPRTELGARNFFNDVMIAVSCRARGIVLVTADHHHERIREYVGHAVEPPFPERAERG